MVLRRGPARTTPGQSAHTVRARPTGQPGMSGPGAVVIPPSVQTPGLPGSWSARLRRAVPRAVLAPVREERSPAWARTSDAQDDGRGQNRDEDGEVAGDGISGMLLALLR